MACWCPPPPRSTPTSPGAASKLAEHNRRREAPALPGHDILERHNVHAVANGGDNQHVGDGVQSAQLLWRVKPTVKREVGDDAGGWWWLGCAARALTRDDTDMVANLGQ